MQMTQVHAAHKRLAKYRTPRLFEFRNTIALVATDAKKSWVQFAYQGEWLGHSAGPIDFTPEVFAQIIHNFEAQKNPLPVTYEHPDYSGDGRPIPAAGWIHQLKTESDKLYGLVEWTDKAAQMIRDGEYRYCSMVFCTNAKDRKTDEEVGPTLYEVGLTNTPFMDGMDPIMLSRQRAARKGKYKMAIDKAAIADALAALPKDASAEQYHMALEAALLAQAAMTGEPMDAPKAEGEAPEAPEMSAELSAPPPVVEAAADSAAPPASDAAAMALAKLMEATGLDEAGVVAFLSDNADAIAKLAGKQADSGTTAAPADASAMAQDIAAAKLAATQAQLTNAIQQLSAYKAREAAQALSAMESRIDAAVVAGHILPQQKALYVKLGRMDSKALDEELDKLAASPAVPTGRLIKASTSTTDFGGNDAAEKRILRDLRGSSKETIAWALAEHRKQAGKTDRV